MFETHTNISRARKQIGFEVVQGLGVYLSRQFKNGEKLRTHMLIDISFVDQNCHLSKILKVFLS